MTVAATSYLEVRYSVTGQNQWSPITRASAAGEISLDGLAPNVTYDVQVRAVSATGQVSAWTMQTVTAPDLTQRLSQANLAMLRVGGIGSAWTGFSISYTAVANGDGTATATISCTSGTLQDGANNPSYAASSAMLTDTAGKTDTAYLYYDDLKGLGGTLALGVTTNYSDLSANQGRIFVGSATVVFPASGSGTGGGTPGGGCPHVDAWVLAVIDGRTVRMRAGDVRVGDVLVLTDGRVGRVSHSERKTQPGVCITADHGHTLTCSRTAPIELASGDCLPAPELQGQYVRVHLDVPVLVARIDDVRGVGDIPVQHITCENACYWVGDDPAHLFGHHNQKFGGT